MDLGIIGLERSGKTTLFSAVTRGHAHTAAIGTAEPSIGVVKIPDERLDRLCAVLHPRKVTHAEARYLDFPGGLSVRGEGPAPAHLAAMAQCDALVHVARAFRDESVPHPEESIDPQRDIASVNLELTFADLALLQRRYDRLETAVRSARAGEREAGERELALVQRLRNALEQEEPLRTQELSPDERRLTSGYQLLTDKPLLILVNIDEADIGRAREIESEFGERWAGPGVEAAALCGKLEQELTELTDDDAAEFRRELGLEEGGLERMLRLSQQVLGLITFFTVNEAEGRAWPIPAGSTALEAAGRVHSDMARGFIRAEVIGWEELVDCGSLAEARKRGLLRTEGKQYVVQDGQLLHILFNV
jgi:GTP-binding protein YchF